jgi:D-aminoacyl-tRNA deacylase
MRIVLQRVREAEVSVDDQVTARIGPGLLIFLGISKLDTLVDATYLVRKAATLRVFPDTSGKMNLDVKEAHGSLLIVSQFTLYGDCRKGRRPSFDLAAAPDHALELYEAFVHAARQTGIPVATGVFQAGMAVRLVNDGPVTIICDSTHS